MIKKRPPFSKELITIKDIASTCEKIIAKLRDDIKVKLARHGAVVGISGGIDSSVTLALSSRAVGAENVLGIMMPEKDSNPDSLKLAKNLAQQYGVNTIVEDITPALEGFGCYRRRDEAIKRVFPEYDPALFLVKIGIKQSSLRQNLPPVFSLTIVDPDSSERSKLLPVKEYLQIVASSNFKQRARMSMLYHHAERLHYAVVGTPNKHEIEQGFFVKYGDGGVDTMPIGHLYKTQVYQLAEFLGIPQDIICRTPTTDTYSAEQTQEEFFYQLPFDLMDILWYGWENGYDPEEVAVVLEKTSQEIKNVYKNFERKRKTTEYLRRHPILYDEIKMK